MTDGSVGKNGVTCWMAGAVRIVQKAMIVERTERERHFGVIKEQLEFLVRRSATEQNVHAEDSERGR